MPSGREHVNSQLPNSNFQRVRIWELGIGSWRLSRHVLQPGDSRSRVAAAFATVWLCTVASACAEILVRWDQPDVPPPAALGLTTLVVPAGGEGRARALAQGYRVYLEVESAALSAFVPPAGPLAGVLVKGTPRPALLRQLRARLAARGARVAVVDDRGKWPHIRSNWVTKNRDVLQVTGRSAQPWIENNAALIRIGRQTGVRPGSDGGQTGVRPGSDHGLTPTLTYRWQPITLSDAGEGPALDNYLVAIAEAGSFGADLVLPLHEKFQARLLSADPRARAEWTRIRSYLEFYAWPLHARYAPVANIGVVTGEPMLSYEVMNLLLRHNLPFALIAPAELPKRPLGPFKLLVVLDAPGTAAAQALERFEAAGGTVHRVTGGVADPNEFALEVRKMVGAEHRVIEIWNGITVMAAPYQAPDGESLVLTAVNYAHQTLPVQIRVPGAYSTVQFESPEEPATLLPHSIRNGYTEFVLPALQVGGRVFLTRP